MSKSIVTKEPEDKNESADPKETTTVSVTITTKGSAELMESIQEHTGFIEEKLHEQIINDIQNWMNKNYIHLVEFYTRATKYKLVPGDQVNLILVENDLLRSKLKRYEDEFGRLKDDREARVETPEGEKTERVKDNREARINNPKEETPELPEPITVHLGIRKLKKIAKEMKISVEKGLTKEEIFSLIDDELNNKE